MVYKDISQAPTDGVRVSANEAAQSQWEIINDWKPKHEVWALTFGQFIKGTVCGLSGFYINSYYRRKLKLGKFGHTTSYLPMVIIPTFIAGFLNFEFVTSNIIIRKDECEVCTEIKSLVFQGLIGVGYPLLLGPGIGYFMASSFNTCRMPVINREPKKMWEFHKATSRHLYRGSLTYLLAINLITASVMTYLEFKNFYSLEEKLVKIEKDLIAKGIVFQ